MTASTAAAAADQPATSEPEWRHQAACRDADPALFTPAESSVGLLQLRLVSTDYCADCPVRIQCGLAADRGQEIGLWAGAYRSGRGAGYRWTLLPGGWRPRVGQPVSKPGRRRAS